MSDQNEVPLPPPAARIPMLQLPSGVILNLEKISWIARHELNKYIVVMDGLSQKMPLIDGTDLDVLRAIGLIQTVTVDQPAAANEPETPKIVTE